MRSYSNDARVAHLQQPDVRHLHVRHEAAPFRVLDLDLQINHLAIPSWACIGGCREDRLASQRDGYMSFLSELSNQGKTGLGGARHRTNVVQDPIEPQELIFSESEILPTHRDVNNTITISRRPARNRLVSCLAILHFATKCVTSYAR